MNALQRSGERGVALVVVMWIVLLLALLISGFAFAMHVETQVASYSRKQVKAEALAVSGVELARLVLIQDLTSATAGGFDALDQDWRTNTTWFVNHELGDGVVNVRITDEESKLPVNRATAEQWHRLFDAMGVDAGDADVVVDSILDWIDGDDLHKLNGAESDYYESLDPPYRAKNGPFDRVEELLLVNGVTPELLYGTPATEDSEAVPGLLDLITTTSTGQINVNTASPYVLHAMLGLDDQQIESVLSRRQGPDGVEGTDDDQPFRNLGEFLNLIGQLNKDAQRQLSTALTVNSGFFTVKSTGQIGNVRRTVKAIVRRYGARVSVVSWHEMPGSGQT